MRSLVNMKHNQNHNYSMKTVQKRWKTWARGHEAWLYRNNKWIKQKKWSTKMKTWARGRPAVGREQWERRQNCSHQQGNCPHPGVRKKSTWIKKTQSKMFLMESASVTMTIIIDCSCNEKRWKPTPDHVWSILPEQRLWW